MASSRFDVTTVGEVMLRLSVPAGYRLEAASQLDLAPGGAEANVVAALAQLGRRCAWFGALPSNALGRLVARHLRVAGIDLGGVVWFEAGRLGTYYVDFAVPPRPIQVIYDRADSCAARLGPEQIDWLYLLSSRILHLTGITPALSPSCHSVVTQAIARAKEAGLAISFDINYRQKLWTTDRAREVLTPLIQGVDLLFCAEGDARGLLGCEGTPEEIATRVQQWSSAHQVVISLKDRGVIASDGIHFWQQPALPVQIIDRLGAGDALAAGVLHGWLDGDLQQGLQYGVALAALALSQHGDMLVTNEEEVRALLSQSDRRVER